MNTKQMGIYFIFIAIIGFVLLFWVGISMDFWFLGGFLIGLVMFIGGLISYFIGKALGQ